MNWQAYADHIVNLLEKDGPLAVDTVKAILAAVEALSGKDFAGVFVALNRTYSDVSQLVADVRKEFDLALSV